MAVRERTNDVERVGDRYQARRSFQEPAEGVDLFSGPVREVLERAIPDFAVLAIGLAEKDSGRGVSVGDDRHVHVDMLAHVYLSIHHNLAIYMTTLRRPQSSSPIKIKEFT